MNITVKLSCTKSIANDSKLVELINAMYYSEFIKYEFDDSSTLYVKGYAPMVCHLCTLIGLTGSSAIVTEVPNRNM